MTTETTLTVINLAEQIRDGEVTVAARDTDLSVEALADPSGPDCYPDTVIEFRRGDEVIAEVGCWMLGMYMHGPNRRDNGQYIGDGWQWQTDDSDGATTGRPRYYISRDGQSVTWQESAGSLASLTLPCGSESDPTDDDGDVVGRDAAIDTIQEAIDDAYAEISVSAADDEDVIAEMTRHNSDIDMDIEILGETIRVGLYSANDAGRKVYTFDGATTVYEDAEDCVSAARSHLRESIQDAVTEGIESDNDSLAEKLASTLEDA